MLSADMRVVIHHFKLVDFGDRDVRRNKFLRRTALQSVTPQQAISPATGQPITVFPGLLMFVFSIGSRASFDRVYREIQETAVVQCGKVIVATGKDMWNDDPEVTEQDLVGLGNETGLPLYLVSCTQEATREADSTALLNAFADIWQGHYFNNQSIFANAGGMAGPGAPGSPGVGGGGGMGAGGPGAASPGAGAGAGGNTGGSRRKFWKRGGNRAGGGNGAGPSAAGGAGGVQGGAGGMGGGAGGPGQPGAGAF